MNRRTMEIVDSHAQADRGYWVKRIFVQMAGDLNAGILLGQIVYWFGRDKHGRRRVRVQKYGEWWVAKSRAQWSEELYMSEKQVDRALKILETNQLIVKEIHRFNGLPVVHVRLNDDMFDQVYDESVALIDAKESRSSPLGDNEDDEEMETRYSPNGNNDELPNVSPVVDERELSLTETTTENKKKHVLRTCLVPRCAAPIPDDDGVEAIQYESSRKEPEYTPIEEAFDNSGHPNGKEENVPRALHKAYMGCPHTAMQRLIDAFTEETEIAPRPMDEKVSKTQSRKYFAYLNSEWRTPLAEFWKRCDGDVDETENLLRQACQRHLDEKLSLKGPKSVEYQFVQLLADQKRAGKVDQSASISLLEHWMARNSS